MTPQLSQETREALRAVSTATLTTCLFKRGLRNTFVQGISPVASAGRSMVGEAFTLRYIPSREDIDHLGMFEDPRHPQRLAIETITPGHVLMIDARRTTRAATAGGILVLRAMMRGAEGIVTDGGLRDTPDIAALPFPV